MLKRTNLLCLGVLLCVGTTAYAQEAVKPAPASTLSDSSERAPVAEDESIYVVQERGFSKSEKLEVDVFLTTKVNPKFVGYIGVGLSAALHLRENFAIEVNTTIPIDFAFQSFYSDLVYEVFTYEDLAPQKVDLKVMTYAGSLNMQFSALYGKLSFYSWLLDYDLYVSAGVGVARTLQSCFPTNQDGCSEEFDVGRGLREQADFTDVWKLTGNIGGGLRFFFSDFMGIRFELRDIVYSDRDIQDNETSTDIRNNLMFSSGVSFLF